MNQLIASLFSALEREGRPVGPGILLAIQQLLQQLPADTAPQTLKTLITPLLSSTPQEQERVYELFEEAIIETAGIQYKGDHNIQKRVTDKKGTPEPLLKSLILVFVIAVCTAMAGLGIWYFIQPDITPSPTPLPQTTAAQPVPKDTFTQTPQIAQPAQPAAAITEIRSNSTRTLWISLVLIIIVLFSLWRYLAYHRRKLIAEHGRKNKPPYAWNIQIPGAEDEVITGAMYHHVLQVLRRRGATSLQLLDLTGTVNATAAKGGIPEFRYRSTTEPVDYLLLIDRQTYHNHRARFFDTLYRAFRDQEVDIHRFFYDSDIQVCFNEEHPYGIRIGELQQRYHNARLMVVGTGFQLSHPASGGLYAWTSVFALWKQRLLLTPRPLMQWGNNETQLSGLFTVLPATLQSLGFWLDELDSGQDLRFDNWREHIKDAPIAPVLPDENNPMTDLEQVYSKGMLQWIAACAIFPTIHWDLTLWLGRATGQLAGNTTASATDMLLHLFRLPWFVGGEIPTPARAALLQWFQQNNPALLNHLRTSLVDILSQNPPPADAVAFDEYRMNLAMQEWLVTKDAGRRKILEEEVARLLEAGHEADFTVIKELRRPGTPLDFEVPRAWRKYFYGNDFPGLGSKGLPRVIAKISMVAALIAFWNTTTWRLKKIVRKTTRVISSTSPRTKMIWILSILLILITSVFVIQNVWSSYQFSEKVKKAEEMKSRNMLKDAHDEILEAKKMRPSDSTAIKLRWEILRMALEQHIIQLEHARAALRTKDVGAFQIIMNDLEANRANASILVGDDSTQFYIEILSREMNNNVFVHAVHNSLPLPITSGINSTGLSTTSHDNEVLPSLPAPSTNPSVSSTFEDILNTQKSSMLGITSGQNRCGIDVADRTFSRDGSISITPKKKIKLTSAVLYTNDVGRVVVTISAHGESRTGKFRLTEGYNPLSFSDADGLADVVLVPGVTYTITLSLASTVGAVPLIENSTCPETSTSNEDLSIRYHGNYFIYDLKYQSE